MLSGTLLNKQNQKVFLCMDFETTNRQDNWYCVCMLVATYPSGKILHSFEKYCTVTKEDFDQETLIFWNQHEEAYKSNDKHRNAMSQSDVEKEICKFISDIRSKYLGFYVVSDNPTFDICILNQILQRYKYDKIMFREDGYFQPIDTWSYRLGICNLLQISARRIQKVSRNLYQIQREIENIGGLHHTPKADCARMLSEHFRVRDFILFNNNKNTSKKNIMTI